MKSILITGANSYIGQCFEQYVAERFPEDYRVYTVDTMADAWKQTDFSQYDCVFHVAGIAHRKETRDNAPLYYAVNRDLTVQIAQAAKTAGVRQFVFLSSMSVYGVETGYITRQTEAAPKTNYGKSKLEAEQQLASLADNSFTLTVLRPPMVYGKNCRGNFQAVVKLVKKLPFFPKVNNQRSMIHIENLCSYVAYCIREELGGLHLPQDPEYMNTSEMAAYIAVSLGKKLALSSLLGLVVRMMLPFLKPAQKAFGSLTYAQEDRPVVMRSNEEAVKDSI